MKFFGKQKKDESENITENVSDVGLEGFEQELENTLKEEHTQVIATKKEESKSKAMVRTLLDAGYSIEEVNTFIKSKKSFGLDKGQIIIQE
jgi:hypothetical protein